MRVHTLHAFNDNYIWAIEIRPGRFAVVDPGQARPVLDFLQAEGGELAAILVTHHHPDHVSGIEALLAQQAVPVYGPATEAVPGMDHPLREGDRVVLDELELETLDVPGHTRGHIAFVADGALFCGDTLFTGGCGRLFEGTPEQMQASLAKLRALGDDTMVYCGHEYTLDNLAFAKMAEPQNAAVLQRLEAVRSLRERGLPAVPSTLAEEKRTNPFLRWDDPEVKAAAERYRGHALDTDWEVFAAVRDWKDELDG